MILPIDNKKRFFIWSIMGKCLLAVFILFVVWLYGLNSFVRQIPTGVNDNESKADAIVILTGGSRRFEEGLKLLYNENAEKLFVSGVGEDVTLANMLLLSTYVPVNIAHLAKKIELGYEAKNTKGNAEEVYNWIRENKISSIRLVTANYHMKRSIIEFDKKMPDIKIIPHPVMPEQFVLEKWWQRKSMKKLLISEYNKYLVTKIGLSV